MEPLTTKQRAERVLTSQGRAIGLLGSFPPDIQDAMAKLCDDTGNLSPDTRDEAAKILARHYEAQKAVVDDNAGMAELLTESDPADEGKVNDVE